VKSRKVRADRCRNDREVPMDDPVVGVARERERA